MAERRGVAVRTTSPTKPGAFVVVPPRIESPWIRVELLIQVNITERIDNVGTGGNDFVSNTQVWSDISPHGRVWLSNTERFSDDGVKHGRFLLPCLQGNRREMSSERVFLARVK